MLNDHAKEKLHLFVTKYICTNENHGVEQLSVAVFDANVEYVGEFRQNKTETDKRKTSTTIA